MIFDKATKTIQWGKGCLSINSAVGTSYLHRKERNKVGSLPNIILKTQLKMDRSPKCKW